MILDQIKSKRKAKTKLPSLYAKKAIVYPSSLSLEQCSSEETALFKAGLMKGDSLVDLTGGFGIDTYHLAQHFKEVVYVEQQKNLAEIVRHNYGALDVKIEVINELAESYLSTIDAVDWIYLDPARRDANSNKVFRLQDCSPDVSTLQQQLLNKSENVMIKLSPLLDIKLALKELNHVAHIYVLAVKNEVKELLFHLNSNSQEETKIHCINLAQKGKQEFTFNYSDEEVFLDHNVLDRFLYEPNAAVLKAGAFKAMVDVYGVKKLAANTHLYTSTELVPNFPGRAFRVTSELPLKRIKNAFPKMKANITVRNYPMSVNEIRKKTKIDEGGDDYIFAFTDIKAKRFVLCQKEY